MLIIRTDNGVLQPNGEFSSNVQTQEEEAGLIWWHILLIIVAGVAVAGSFPDPLTLTRQKRASVRGSGNETSKVFLHVQDRSEDAF